MVLYLEPVSEENIDGGFELHELAPFLARVLRHQTVRGHPLYPDLLCELIGAFSDQECVIRLRNKTVYFVTQVTVK